MLLKSRLRQDFRARLAAFEHESGHEVVAQASRDLCAALIHFLQRLLANQSVPSGGAWAAFQPFGFEPDIRPALDALTMNPNLNPNPGPDMRTGTGTGTGIDWVFPRIDGETLSFHRPDTADAFIVNRWGIREPDPERSRLVAASELAGFLVPGLAFDRHCRRLGRGRGFYDRALATLSKDASGNGMGNNNSHNNHNRNRNHNYGNGIKIGIALDCQISETDLPLETFDVVMDCVLTERRQFVRAGILPDDPTAHPPDNPTDCSPGNPTGNSRERKTS